MVPCEVTEAKATFVANPCNQSSDFGALGYTTCSWEYHNSSDDGGVGGIYDNMLLESIQKHICLKPSIGTWLT